MAYLCWMCVLAPLQIHLMQAARTRALANRSDDRYEVGTCVFIDGMGAARIEKDCKIGSFEEACEKQECGQSKGLTLRCDYLVRFSECILDHFSFEHVIASQVSRRLSAREVKSSKTCEIRRVPDMFEDEVDAEDESPLSVDTAQENAVEKHEILPTAPVVLQSTHGFEQDKGETEVAEPSVLSSGEQYESASREASEPHTLGTGEVDSHATIVEDISGLDESDTPEPRGRHTLETSADEPERSESSEAGKYSSPGDKAAKTSEDDTDLESSIESSLGANEGSTSEPREDNAPETPGDDTHEATSTKQESSAEKANPAPSTVDVKPESDRRAFDALGTSEVGPRGNNIEDTPGPDEKDTFKPWGRDALETSADEPERSKSFEAGEYSSPGDNAAKTSEDDPDLESSIESSLGANEGSEPRADNAPETPRDNTHEATSVESNAEKTNAASSAAKIEPNSDRRSSDSLGASEVGSRGIIIEDTPGPDEKDTLEPLGRDVLETSADEPKRSELFDAGEYSSPGDHAANTSEDGSDIEFSVENSLAANEHSTSEPREDNAPETSRDNAHGTTSITPKQEASADRAISASSTIKVKPVRDRRAFYRARLEPMCCKCEGGPDNIVWSRFKRCPFACLTHFQKIANSDAKPVDPQCASAEAASADNTQEFADACSRSCLEQFR
eukprot:TRINITY_DN9682_c0_g1_i1.p1 TRINITY_DN9682_c0_g1~~TRINITY_DN9682_c0_g1_i1.p1  ORF type:complete len:676 (-),score=54.62 TRINITY_DN9682_c0_g1_i1:138-2165(-)